MAAEAAKRRLVAREALENKFWGGARKSAEPSRKDPSTVMALTVLGARPAGRASGVHNTLGRYVRCGAVFENCIASGKTFFTKSGSVLKYMPEPLARI